MIHHLKMNPTKPNGKAARTQITLKNSRSIIKEK
jgi:hypothetical protein